MIIFVYFFFNDTATTEIYTLSLHDALPIYGPVQADDVKARLESEDFQQVAADVNASGGFADSDGYVGWVPEGAFPDFDKLLFPTDEGSAFLEVGGISDPQFTGEDGIFIIHKLRSEEHTSELQSLVNLVCRLLLEKKKNKQTNSLCFY
mgnify:CR=1 FL=1